MKPRAARPFVAGCRFGARVWGIGLLLAVMGVASHSAASGLQCYAVKDPVKADRYLMDLDALQPEPGCLLTSSAKLLCVPGDQANLDPVPPNEPATMATGQSFLTYKVKCPKVDPPAAATVSDLFGDRDVAVKKTKLLGVPLGGSATGNLCCNAITSGVPLGCYDFVPGVNSLGEVLCGSSFMPEATIGAAGEVCGGGTGSCGPQFFAGGSCCAYTDVGGSGLHFCVEAATATITSACGLVSGTLLPDGRCGVDGDCYLP